MIQVYEYDENFMLTKPILIELDDEDKYIIPENCTEIQPPAFFKSRFYPEEQTWKEAATLEEIDEILRQAEQETETLPIDILKTQNAKLTLRVAATEKENGLRRQREADTTLLIAQLQKQISELKEVK